MTDLQTAPAPTNLLPLLGHNPASQPIAHFLHHLASLVPAASTVPEVKSYPDVVYFNYFPCGLSLQFKPVDGYKPRTGLKREELRDDALVLDSIDLYNVPKTQNARGRSPYSTYPVDAFSLPLVSTPDKPRASVAEVRPTTTGKEFVASMGEPDRKGGGAGPASGSIGIWCEWSKDGIMVEFGGDESRGPQAWETGKDAVWKVMTIFRP